MRTQGRPRALAQTPGPNGTAPPGGHPLERARGEAGGPGSCWGGLPAGEPAGRWPPPPCSSLGQRGNNAASMPGAGPGRPDCGATWRPGRAAWPQGGLAPGPGLGRAGSPASSGRPLSGQPRLPPPPSPASPCPVVGSGVRPTRLCHVCHPPGTQEHLSKIPGGRGRAAAAASGPPSPGSQCQMRAGDKSSIFLVLLGWQQSLPQHHLAPGSPASGGRGGRGPGRGGRDWGTDGRGWPGRAGRLRARRHGAGTWGRPAGRRDPSPPAVPGLARGHHGHVLALEKAPQPPAPWVSHLLPFSPAGDKPMALPSCAGCLLRFLASNWLSEIQNSISDPPPHPIFSEVISLSKNCRKNAEAKPIYF
ncbi:translation initiation factor IF-2-like [Vulpes lagopus]|uniref:translation initiation factor IF-2-like n=1 Tax=Vulpes lagopus TaxID=494514 RepID=UPI001BC9F572|nr:translation initiation factor IF-2-like [Vulpes lagopus]XP_041610757.1 translation initiation factor IF-2-like [Vulpes lagopus]XP_041610758.1 translation initiation factor IF-2-like [Vulpes lagopus]XP_041610759.1 translation initiation factor IF-2-like [Vulpes lagopus]XP_041610761.1 translation initiation factor IF-2-like [Vulpes lagopus]XP_041610762.1 translation initiation factor IF-2-like [Vulpes lagopus]XP_041610763.1 translation initiation factor IF-2-like [Vulpes lagopus]XP_04161076